jgi:hypothetical protein
MAAPVATFRQIAGNQQPNSAKNAQQGSIDEEQRKA